MALTDIRNAYWNGKRIGNMTHDELVDALDKCQREIIVVRSSFMKMLFAPRGRGGGHPLFSWTR